MLSKQALQFPNLITRFQTPITQYQATDKDSGINKELTFLALDLDSHFEVKSGSHFTNQEPKARPFYSTENIFA
jgi:hypothetical protein